MSPLSSLATCPPFLPIKLWSSLLAHQKVKACQCWQQHCQTLLNAPAEPFWSAIFESPAFLRFLSTFVSSFRFVLAFEEQEETIDENEAQPVKNTLLTIGRQVLLILLRLTEPTELADEQCAPDTAIDYLMKTSVFDAPGLFDMAGTYGFSNTAMVLDLLNGVILLSPTFVDEFERLLVEAIHVLNYPTITLAFSNTPVSSSVIDDLTFNTGTSKGKGNANIRWTTTPIDDSEVDWFVLLDLITALDAFMNVMAKGCLPLQIRLFSLWPGWLLVLDTLYPRIGTTSSTGRRCKYGILSIANKLLEYRYFAQLSVNENDSNINAATTPSYEGEICLKKSEQMERAATQCCDSFLELLTTVDEATSDHALEEYRFLETAPLLVDLEIEFKLSDRITSMLSSFEQSGETRVDYVLLSLRHFKETLPDSKSLCDQFVHSTFNAQRKKTSAIKAVPFSSAKYSSSNNRKLVTSIEQIEAIFPGLGHGFIAACLDVYHGEVETVITRLLEEDLPYELQIMDRQAPRILTTLDEAEVVSEYEDALNGEQDDEEEDEPGCCLEKTDFLSTRKNIYDNDEFDVFAHNTLNRERVYQGKKETSNIFNSHDNSLTANYKSSIIERAMASDEDEYDDTYDGIYDANGEGGLLEGEEIEGIALKGKTPMAASSNGPSLPADPTLVHEPTLMQLYISNPALFDRSAQSRRSAERVRLRDTTGLSNEQIEGWAVQLVRDPKRYQGLINNSGAEWQGEQPAITLNHRNNVNSSNSNSNSNSNQHTNSTRGHALKDRHKAQRANHNRKRGHARKMRDTLPQ